MRPTPGKNHPPNRNDWQTIVLVLLLWEFKGRVVTALTPADHGEARQRVGAADSPKKS